MQTLSELHKDALSQVLRRLLALRPSVDAWNFLTSTDATENLKLLFHAEAHHLVGKTESRVSLLPSTLYQTACGGALMGQNTGDAQAHLQAVDDPNAQAINTTWYKIPARAYGNISVGAVVSGNEDMGDFLSLDKSRRISRYIRDDSRGDFLTYSRNSTHVEIFFNFPRGTCHRVRALLRFEALQFDLFMRTIRSGDDILAGLLGAITTSHLVQEQRQCPFCHCAPSACFCEFRALPPGQGVDGLFNNARNMFEQVGEYYGRSYHYERNRGYLQEHFNKNIVLAIDRVKGESLRQWAAQHCCSLLPIVASPLPCVEVLTPPGLSSTMLSDGLSRSVSPLMLPDAVAGTSNAITAVSMPLPIQSSVALPGAPAVGSVPIQIPVPVPIPEPALSDMSFDTGLPASSYAAELASVIPGGLGMETNGDTKYAKGVINGVGVGAGSTNGIVAGLGVGPAITKPKRRGRKPRAPIIRPVQPVPIAPVPGGAVRAPTSEFQSAEEWRQHQKKLRSRMSAAKSNAKRAEKNREEKRRAAAERGQTTA